MDKMYTLNLTAPQVEIIWAAIHKAPLPREYSDPLVAEISKQVNEQKEEEKKEEIKE